MFSVIGINAFTIVGGSCGGFILMGILVDLSSLFGNCAILSINVGDYRGTAICKRGIQGRNSGGLFTQGL